MKPWKKNLLILALALIAVLAINTPARLNYSPTVTEDRSLEDYLVEPVSLLVAGTEKQLTWHADTVTKTEWSVVALHGFSASRQETAPLAELVAKNLGANLYETRFASHGLKENGLVDIKAEEWLDDVADALTVGDMIGEKIVVFAVSNGAALALAMLDHPTVQSADALILLSPNFGPADPKVMWATYPGGPLLLRLVAGSTRSWDAQNEQQEIYWTTSYPMQTIVEVIRVVDRAIRKIRTVAAPRIQLIYSPDDKVVSISALKSAYVALNSPHKEIVEVSEYGNPYAHIIAGDIISPDNTVPLSARITDFVLRGAP